MKDRETGRSRGFGFVTYGTQQEADAAIAGLNEQELDGRRIRVNMANSRPIGYVWHTRAAFFSHPSCSMGAGMGAGGYGGGYGPAAMAPQGYPGGYGKFQNTTKKTLAESSSEGYGAPQSAYAGGYGAQQGAYGAQQGAFAQQGFNAQHPFGGPQGYGGPQGGYGG